MADPKAIKAGRAEVEASFNEAGLKAGLDAAKQHLQNFAKQTSTIMVGGGGALAGIGAMIEAPLALAMKAAVSDISNIRKAADQLGESTDSFSKVSYAASKVGLELDGVVGAGRKLERMIAEAKDGNKAAAESFNKLGLNAAELDKLPIDEKMKAIADAIAKLPSESDRTQAAFSLLGRTGVALLPILRQGGDALERMFEQGRERGLIVSPEEAERVKAFTKNVGALEQTFQGLKRSVGLAVLPDQERLERFTNAATRAIVQVREWVEANKDLVAGLSLAAAGAVAAGTAFVAFGALAASTTTIVSGLATVMNILLAPELLVAAGLVAISAAGFAAGYGLMELTHSAEENAKAAEGWGIVWKQAGDTFAETWTGIKDSLKTGDLEGALQVAVDGMDVVWKQFIFDLTSAWYDFKAGLRKDLYDIGTAAEKAGAIGTAGIFHGAAFQIDDSTKQLNAAMKGLQDAQAKLNSDVKQAAANVLNDEFIRGLDKVGQLDLRPKGGGAGLSPSEQASIIDTLSSVASGRQFGGQGAREALSFGPGVRKSDETKELEKANRKLDEMNKKLDHAGLNWED
jgi:hypothetical protein